MYYNRKKIINEAQNESCTDSHRLTDQRQIDKQIDRDGDRERKRENQEAITTQFEKRKEEMKKKFPKRTEQERRGGTGTRDKVK